MTDKPKPLFASINESIASELKNRLPGDVEVSTLSSLGLKIVTHITPTNDKETLKAMLIRANIKFVEETDPKGSVMTVERGYSGFATSFQFDSNGSLLDMGAYE